MAGGMDAAPLLEDVADCPEGGRAWWLTTTDGTRIRLALWAHPSPKGTVLMFPGRTEYIEKYGRFARDMHEAGYAVAAVDWRGQGLSDRAIAPRDFGHVNDFMNFQQDVEAVVSALTGLEDAPRPWNLVAHSMGGCIGLRALHRGLDVDAVAFTGPMWGINLSPAQQKLAQVMGVIAPVLGWDTKLAPTTKRLGPGDFATNEITSCPEQFAFIENQIQRHPMLGLGGPTTGWLLEAIAECKRLTSLPAPDQAALTFLGSDETIAWPEAIKSTMAKWPNGELEVVDGAKHEILMETPVLRAAAIAQMLEWFEDAAKT